MVQARKINYGLSFRGGKRIRAVLVVVFVAFNLYFIYSNLTIKTRILIFIYSNLTIKTRILWLPPVNNVPYQKYVKTPERFSLCSKTQKEVRRLPTVSKPGCFPQIFFWHKWQEESCSVQNVRRNVFRILYCFYFFCDIPVIMYLMKWWEKHISIQC